jgi:hypothetical protein
LRTRQFSSPPTNHIGLRERSEIDFVMQACVLVQELGPIPDTDDQLGLHILRGGGGGGGVERGSCWRALRGEVGAGLETNFRPCPGAMSGGEGCLHLPPYGDSTEVQSDVWTKEWTEKFELATYNASSNWPHITGKFLLVERGGVKQAGRRRLPEGDEDEQESRQPCACLWSRRRPL